MADYGLIIVTMKLRLSTYTVLLAVLLAASPAAAPLSSQVSRPQAFARTLECAKSDCSLLEGAPQTAGMRSGFVRLKPGETVGWHTTGQHEEALVIMSGAGAALIEEQPQHDFIAPALVYIPPATRHNVSNTGKSILEYVYVVAPAKANP